MKIFLLLLFAIFSYAQNENEEFLKTLESYGLRGNLTLNSTDYAERVMEFVEKDIYGTPCIICEEYLGKISNEDDRMIIYKYMVDFEKFRPFAPKYEDYDAEYRSVIEKLLNNATDLITYANINACKKAPSSLMIYNIRQYCRWADEDKFRRLHRKHYIRASWEYVLYNTDVTPKNFVIISKALQTCLMLDNYFPLLPTRREKRKSREDIRRIIEKTVEKTTLAKKGNKRILKDFINQKMEIEQSKKLAESLIDYCEKELDELVKVANFSVIHNHHHYHHHHHHTNQSIILQRNTCVDRTAHFKLQTKLMNSDSKLMNELKPYCHYSLELVCSFKFDTEFVKYNWFDIKFEVEDSEFNYEQHGKSRILKKLTDMAEQIVPILIFKNIEDI